MKQSLKALPKKLLAVFLALLTCLALLPSALYATSVSAEETTITIINLPRGGGTGWNTNEVHLMNGWVVEANDHFPAISIGGENGQVAYCIQPGTELHTGSSLTQYGENYWNAIPGNSSLSRDDIRAYIGRVMRYGYQGTNSLSWDASNPEHANAMGAEIATHVLIWEVLVGERDENFNKINANNYGCNNVLEMFPASYPIYSYIISNYNSIVAAVQSHVTVPSFMSNRTATATTVEMTWNADNQRYEAVLTDTNNVLGNFSFSTSDSSVSCSVAGNQLTVYSNNAPSGDVSITATKNAQSVGSVVWSDGVVNPNTGDLQDVVTYSATINDPLQAYVNVKVGTGALKIIKTAEDGNVANIRMHISHADGSGGVADVYTGEDGTIQVDNLQPGDYIITEYPSEQYAPQPGQTVTVVAGQTAEVRFHNTLIRGSVSGLKIDRETGDTIAGATFGIFAPDETEFTEETSLLEPAVTGEDGTFTFGNLVYGSYLIRELEPAPGYLPNDTIYPVSITEDGQVVEITVVNDQVPEIGTEATVDGGKETHPFEEVTITDTVSYQHLIPGQEYTITGILIDKSTGEALLVDGEEITSEVTFTPEEANDTVEAEFTFDASGITVTTDVVAFEALYKDDIELAAHADINDEGQTITIKVPEIHTTATVDGGKETVQGGTVTIEDVVDYNGLIPGQEYTITSILIDKSTGEAFTVDGEEITNEVNFVPETADGSVTVTFAFDTSAISSDTSIVVFEDLIQDGIELATHADINDEGQTVTITIPQPVPVPQTGDMAWPMAVASGGLVLSLTAAGYLAFMLRRKNN